MTTQTHERRLFSYVVHHDNGNAPCVGGGTCSLAVCKFSKSGKPNVVELARIGDWVVGTGGASSKSAGHGRLVYAMRVTDKVSMEGYLTDPRFRARQDVVFARPRPFAPDRVVLLSDEFWYFGSNAPDISTQPWNRDGKFEKRGPGFRSKFSPAVIAAFERWLRAIEDPGVHGVPCQSRAAKVIAPPIAEPTRSGSGHGRTKPPESLTRSGTRPKPSRDSGCRE